MDRARTERFTYATPVHRNLHYVFLVVVVVLLCFVLFFTRSGFTPCVQVKLASATAAGRGHPRVGSTKAPGTIGAPRFRSACVTFKAKTQRQHFSKSAKKKFRKCDEAAEGW